MAARVKYNHAHVTKQLNALLTRKVEKTKEDADALVLKHAYLLYNYIVENWPVDTGFSRASITPPERIGFAHYRIRITAAYAIIIEYGGYRGVGPKTAQEGGIILPGGIQIGPGIFPIQKPYAPVRRGLSRIMVSLEKDLKEAVA